MPKRIQRKRTKGWKMPANTVYVGRPSYYGNPFRTDRVLPYDLFYKYGLNTDHFSGYKKAIRGVKISPEEAVRYYGKYVIGQKHRVVKEEIIRELKGKNLACWCPLDQPCHADFLLKFVNK